MDEQDIQRLREYVSYLEMQVKAGLSLTTPSPEGPILCRDELSRIYITVAVSEIARKEFYRRFPELDQKKRQETYGKEKDYKFIPWGALLKPETD